MSFKEPYSKGSFEHPVIMKTDDAIMALASEMLTKKSALLKKYDLSFQQYTILRTLIITEGKPASIKSLTEEMLDKMSNTSRLVTKLEKKGFVDRKISATDRRQVAVVITETGENIFKEAVEELNKVIFSAYQSLDDAELTTLLKSLQKLKDY